MNIFPIEILPSSSSSSSRGSNGNKDSMIGEKDIFDRANTFLCFKNKLDKFNYNLFRKKRIGSSSFYVIVFASILLSIAELVELNRTHNKELKCRLLIVTILNFIGNIFGFLKCITRLWGTENEDMTVAALLANGFLLAHMFGGGLGIFFVTVTPTVHSDLTFFGSCDGGSTQVPGGFALFFLFMPMVATILISNIDWWALVLSWMINCFFILLSCIYANSYAELVILEFAAILVGCALYDYRRKTIEFFMILQQERNFMEIKQEKELAEAKLQTSVLQQNELRHTIANIAHDLKTPVSALATGCELMMKTVKKLQEDYETNEKKCRSDSIMTSTTVEEGGMVNSMGMIHRSEEANYFTHFHLKTKQEMTEMMSTLLSFQHSCTFMLMIINRCIDYSKCTFGLTLYPREDHFLLQKMVQESVDCVRDLQTCCQGSQLVIVDEKAGLKNNVQSNAGGAAAMKKTTIKEKSSSQMIHINMDENLTLPVHLITSDRQWLLENLLCAVSNAVKFSGNECEVQVRVSLIEEMDAKENNSALSTRQATMSPKKPLRQSMATLRNILSSDSRQTSMYSNHKRQMIRFEIEDKGIGIPMDQRKQILEPIKQSIRSMGGTGLGMHCIKKRTEALQGDFGIENRADGTRGTLVWFSVPYVFFQYVEKEVNEAKVVPINTRMDNILRTVSEDKFLADNFKRNQDHVDLESGNNARSVVTLENIALQDKSIAGLKTVSEESSNLLQSSKPQPEKLKVLVVDDALPILKMKTRLLEKEGYQVNQAINGLEALKLMDQHHFDVILMDLQMPIMDGFQATMKIRERESRIRSGQEAGSYVGQILAEDNGCDEKIDDDGGTTLTSSPNLNIAEITTLLLPTKAFSKESFQPEQQQQQLHSHAKNHQQPVQSSQRQLVIGCSANSDNMTIQEAFQAGIDAFIPKPFSLMKFQEIVNNKLLQN